MLDDEWRLLLLRYLFRTIFAAAIAFANVSAPLAVSAQSAAAVSLRTGQSIIVKTVDITRVAVGDGKIAGVVPIGTSAIVINGKAAGQTTLFVWTRSGRKQYDITVTEQNLDDLRKMLQAAIGDPDIHVASFDNSLVISGSVATTERLVHLREIVARFDPVVTANKYLVVDAVTVTNPLGPLQSDLSSNPATANVRVDRDLKGNLVVSGRVPDRTAAELVLGRVRALAGPYLATDGKVIDRLESATVSQVDVKVYVLEVDDTGLRDLGVSLQSARFNADGTYTLGSPQFPAVEALGAIGKALNIGGFFRTITLAPTLNAVLTSGHAHLLSSPDLVTLPGREANFLVGGQIPIPLSQGLSQVSIVYKDYGVQLKVTPTLLGDGSVETVIASEVSDLDFQDGVSLNGFVVPALKTSRLSTDVITKSGESIVMGGLLRRVEQRNITKIPLLGDLPILGKLFRSTRYQTQQSDVVFVMTPTILTR